jgi:hypothetical protein
MLRGLIGCALAAGMAISGAQAQEVAGTWAVDFDQLIRRMPDGRDTVAQRGKALLVIDVKGDSAFGTWTPKGIGGQQRVVNLRGTRKGNTVKLVSDPQSGSRVTPNGTTPVTFVTTYEATVTADAMAGTMTNQSQNSQVTTAGQRARKFEGKREKR